jgi:hypothetical protein
MLRTFHFVANLVKKSPFCVHVFQNFKKLIQPPKFNSIILSSINQIEIS